MRVLESTVEAVTGDLDDERREGLAVVARAGVAMRSTFSIDAHGRREAEVSLRGYDTDESRDGGRSSVRGLSILRL
ncbi:hypothetical protein [Streptomyces chryseus]